MTSYREDEQLMADAIRRAFRPRNEDDARFQRLLDSIERRAQRVKEAA